MDYEKTQQDAMNRAVAMIMSHTMMQGDKKTSENLFDIGTGKVFQAVMEAVENFSTISLKMMNGEITALEATAQMAGVSVETIKNSGVSSGINISKELGL